eukprot:TRINITY_DN469_c0_g1_i3.p1 TRINITY_DN469_c0_g1~~TRINITY_DN469_c0_g1_i3.p1  ORF type:complete len:254 (-),score=96.12 TRINITY_DN469_c0_g1_i3:111-872(-)
MNYCNSYLTNVLRRTEFLRERERCYQDCQLQMYAKEWAKAFNEKKPPKLVDFLAVSAIALVERAYKPICTIEEFIDGHYEKHNTNWGYVSETDRNTPQAFSHFTYFKSNRALLIVDIQGVADIYTDPLMHYPANEEFGRGNLGVAGMQRFVETHRCNAVCRFMGLSPLGVKQQKPNDAGTVPGVVRGRRVRVQTSNELNPNNNNNNNIVANNNSNSNSPRRPQASPSVERRGLFPLDNPPSLYSEEFCSCCIS